MGSGGGSGGGGSTESTQQASIAPELQPLMGQTGAIVSNIQHDYAWPFMLNEAFNPNPQQIPGFTPVQEDIGNFQRMRAFTPVLNSSEQAAQQGLMDLTNSPFGEAPWTKAAMQAARTPILNDAALAGLGNSDALVSNLGSAYAPILAQEEQQRWQAIPQLQNLGQTQANRESQYLGELGTTEEKRRAITEARNAALFNDFMRRQGLSSDFTNRVLGGFNVNAGGTTTSSTTSNQSSKGGGK